MVGLGFSKLMGHRKVWRPSKSNTTLSDRLIRSRLLIFCLAAFSSI